ncbi:MAG: hypothetical protein AABW67_01470 [Nanoarchaeota archaeon]
MPKPNLTQRVDSQERPKSVLEAIQYLMKNFDGSKSGETKHNGLSYCDIVVARYLRKYNEEQRTAHARELASGRIYFG